MGGRLLDTLEPAARARLLALGRPVEYAAGEVLCRTGELAESFHLVQAGWLSVRVSLPDGSTSTVNILGPGDYFGELSLLRPGGRRTATIVALESARTLLVPASAFRATCATSAAMTMTLAVVLAERVDALSQRVVEASYADLGLRVRRRLTELAARRTSIPINQTELAQLVGGSRPAVNVVLRRLVQEGLIEVGRGRIDVLDPEGLLAATLTPGARRP